MFVFPQTVQNNGPRIYMFRPGFLNLNQYRVFDLLRLYIMFTEFAFWDDDQACIHGVTVVGDFVNCTAAHFMQMTPSFLKKFATWVDQAMPLRIKGFHYINTPALFDPIFNLFKSVVPDKLRKRVSYYFFFVIIH